MTWKVIVGVEQAELGSAMQINLFRAKTAYPITMGTKLFLLMVSDFPQTETIMVYQEKYLNSYPVLPWHLHTHSQTRVSRVALLPQPSSPSQQDNQHFL